jgi:hypothetical protein
MDLAHLFKRRDWDPRRVERVQALCLALPEVVEAEQFGGPWWKAGKKPFCSYGGASTRDAGGYHGVDGVTVKVPRLQAALLRDPRFQRERFMGRYGWTHLTFGEDEPDWVEVRDLVVEAYRGVANARQLAKLDAAEAHRQAAPGAKPRRSKNATSRPPSSPAPRSASSPPRRHR